MRQFLSLWSKTAPTSLGIMRGHDEKNPGSQNGTAGMLHGWLLIDHVGQQSVGLSRCSRHLPTLIGTLATRLGTMLAMISIMLLTFSRTRITKISTQLARLLGELRSTTHQSRHRPADLCTVPICSNAVSHLSDMGFTQTRIGTLLAGLGTFHTSFNARTIFFLSHFTSPSMRTVGWHDPPRFSAISVPNAATTNDSPEKGN